MALPKLSFNFFICDYDKITKSSSKGSRFIDKVIVGQYYEEHDKREDGSSASLSATFTLAGDEEKEKWRHYELHRHSRSNRWPWPNDAFTLNENGIAKHTIEWHRSLANVTVTSWNETECLFRYTKPVDILYSHIDQRYVHGVGGAWHRVCFGKGNRFASRRLYNNKAKLTRKMSCRPDCISQNPTYLLQRIRKNESYSTIILFQCYSYNCRYLIVIS